MHLIIENIFECKLLEFWLQKDKNLFILFKEIVQKLA